MGVSAADSLLAVMSFNAAYARVIDDDDLERWPDFFTADAQYRITHVENVRDGLAAGMVYADSRDMLIDRISALREANVYERQRYRHVIGMPSVDLLEPGVLRSHAPFLIIRIMHTGEMTVFASGAYHDEFVQDEGSDLKLRKREVVCDSTSTDTLMAIPL
jgi:3-phenylpropionate/cinnamic acid dioxygenase small subunit